MSVFSCEAAQGVHAFLVTTIDKQLKAVDFLQMGRYVTDRNYGRPKHKPLPLEIPEKAPRIFTLPFVLSPDSIDGLTIVHVEAPSYVRGHLAYECGFRLKVQPENVQFPQPSKPPPGMRTL